MVEHFPNPIEEKPRNRTITEADKTGSVLCLLPRLIFYCKTMFGANLADFGPVLRPFVRFQDTKFGSETHILM